MKSPSNKNTSSIKYRVATFTPKQVTAFATNYIKTSHYNFFTFLPLFLIEEFNFQTKFANCYFLVISCMQIIKPISNTNGLPTTLIPLVCVLCFSAIMKILEDLKRHKSDKLANSSKTRIFNRETKTFEEKLWLDIKVGDFVKIENNEEIPADLLIVNVNDGEENDFEEIEEPEDDIDSVSQKDSREKIEKSKAKANTTCFLETKNLDGETNLKPKNPLTILTQNLTQISTNAENLPPQVPIDSFNNTSENNVDQKLIVNNVPLDYNLIEGYIAYDEPNCLIESFYGYYKRSNDLPLNIAVSNKSVSLSSIFSNISTKVTSARVHSTKSPAYSAKISNPDDKKHYITTNNIALRGCILKSTKNIVGYVLYTGHDVKILQNNKKVKKYSTIEKNISKKIIFILILLFILIIVLIIFQVVNYKRHDVYSIWYLNGEKKVSNSRRLASVPYHSVSTNFEFNNYSNSHFETLDTDSNIDYSQFKNSLSSFTKHDLSYLHGEKSTIEGNYQENVYDISQEVSDKDEDEDDDTLFEKFIYVIQDLVEQEKDVGLYQGLFHHIIDILLPSKSISDSEVNFDNKGLNYNTSFSSSSIYTKKHRKLDDSSYTYTRKTKFSNSYLIFFFYVFLLHASYVPVALYVTINLARFIQAMNMQRDPILNFTEDEIMNNKKKPVDFQGMQVRDMILNEELGRLTHICTDKTGTLTCNKLIFRKFSIGGINYGHGLTEIGRSILSIKKKNLVNNLNNIRSKNGSDIESNEIKELETKLKDIEATFEDEKNLRDMKYSTESIKFYCSYYNNLISNNNDEENIFLDEKLFPYANSVLESNFHSYIDTSIIPTSTPSNLFLPPYPISKTSHAKNTDNFFKFISICHEVYIDQKKTIKNGEPKSSFFLTSTNPDDTTLYYSAKFFGHEFLNYNYNTKKMKFKNHKITGDPSHYWNNLDSENPDNYTLNEIKVLYVIPFTSSRKRMTIIIKDIDGQYKVITKGADVVLFSKSRIHFLNEQNYNCHYFDENFLPSLCDNFPSDLLNSDLGHSNSVREGNWNSHMEVWNHYFLLNSIKKYSREGLRCLVYGAKVISKEQFIQFKTHYDKVKFDPDELLKVKNNQNNMIESLENYIDCDLELIGITAIEDQLQDKVPECILKLREAGLKIWMITGDKEETAINIGMACNLIESNDGLLHNEDYEREVDREAFIETWKNINKKQNKKTNTTDSTTLTVTDPNATIIETPASTELSIRDNPKLQSINNTSFIFLTSSAISNNTFLLQRLSHELFFYGFQFFANKEFRVKYQSYYDIFMKYIKKYRQNDEKLNEFNIYYNDLFISTLLNYFNDIYFYEEDFLVNFVGKTRSWDDPDAIMSIFDTNRTSFKLTSKSLIIDGSILIYLFNDEVSTKLLSLLTFRAASIIFCRCSPAQKSQIIFFIRHYYPSASRVLAIGDGANDVSMIQASHVGIGIRGEEGTEAINSSDFIINQFQFLLPLILYYGKNNLIKNYNIILYIIYKNFFLLNNVFAYNFFNLFSCYKQFTEFALQFYNLFYTSLPIAFYAFSDYVLAPETSLRFPKLYEENKHSYNLVNHKNYLFIYFINKDFITNIFYTKNFFFIIIYSFFESFFLTFFTLFVLQNLIDSYVEYGVIAFTTVVIVSNLKLTIIQNFWTTKHILVMTFSILSWILVSVIISNSKTIDYDFYGVFPRLFGNPMIYVVVILLSSVLIIKDYILLIIQKEFFPSPFTIARELEEEGLKLNNTTKKNKIIPF